MIRLEAVSGAAADISDYPLPAYRHVPGRNARHGDGLLETVAAKADAVTTDAAAGDNPAWRYGLRLFDEGYFWECHEVLETVWARAPQNSRERHLVQAVIQLANAALKQRDARAKAARRLIAIAGGLAERAYAGVPDGQGRVMGIERSFLAAAAGAIANMESVSATDYAL